jgi:hypothetical protein
MLLCVKYTFSLHRCCRQLPDRTSVLGVGHPVVRRLVVDTLRSWALEYALDGFTFVHAEHLTQVRAWLLIS